MPSEPPPRPVAFIFAPPVLASLDIQRSVDFFAKHLGFTVLHAGHGVYGIVYPRAGLADTPWGTREFAILDPDGNLVTFHEPTPP